MNDVINELVTVLQDRKAHPNPNSYTSQLLTDGEDEIVKKIGEEAVEVILAAKGQGDQRIIEETADLIYHTLVLLVSRDLTWNDVRPKGTKLRPRPPQKVVVKNKQKAKPP